MAAPAVARSLFLLSSQERTGLFRIESGASTFRLELERGWVYALGNVPRAGSDEEALVRLLDRLIPEAADRFESRAAGQPHSGYRTTPFHPARLLRVHLEKSLGDRLTRAYGPGDVRLRLAHKPHPSCLGADERIVVDLLSLPRLYRELVSFAPAPRLLALVRFLEDVGALHVEDAALGDAYAALGVAQGAPVDEVKRAYHRLARDLHPDRHPTAALDEKRMLETRFHAVAVAYRRIVSDES